MKSKKCITGFAIGFILCVVIVYSFFLFSKKEYSAYDCLMGTVVNVNINSDNPENVGKQIFEEIRKTENLISRNIPTSDISQINSLGKWNCSEKTLAQLKYALDICNDSNGALDITVGKLSSLWNFDSEANTVPNQSDIEKAKSLCDYTLLKIQDSNVYVPGGFNIDLGAVGKGSACDDAYKVLKDNKATGATVSVGGTVLVYGKNKKGNSWTVGIRTPDINSSDYFAKLKVEGDCFISTSGSYERFFEKDGKLYHHILDRTTGYPAQSNLKSVTVVCNKGVYADGLSTACFVLGYEKSLSLLEKYNASAVFVTKNNKILVTEGLGKDLTVIDSNYSF